MIPPLASLVPMLVSAVPSAQPFSGEVEESNLVALYATSAIVFLALALILMLARRELRAPGFDRLSEGVCAMLLALGLFAGQGRIPELFSVFAANVVVVVGCSVLLHGTRLFFGQKSSWIPTLVALCCGLPLFAFLTWIYPDPTSIKMIRSGFMAAFLGGAAWSTWKQRSKDLLGSVGALSLAGCATILGARFLALITGLSKYGPPTGGIDTAAILVATFAGVVWVSTLLMTVYRHLAERIGEQNNLFSNLLLIARTAGEGPALEIALEETVQLASSLTSASGSSLLLVDERGDFSRGIYSSRDGTEQFSNEDVHLLLAEGLAGWVASERATALIEDVAQDPRWHHLPGQENVICSALCVPIASGPTLAGVLTLVHEKKSWFGTSHRHLIESAAGQIALVLRNAQITDARLQTMADQLLLNRVLEISARGQEADEIAAEAADTIADATRWSQVTVALQGEDGHFRFLGESAELSKVRLALEQGVIGRAFRSGEQQLIEDVSDDQDYIAHRSEVTTEVAIPLVHSGRVLGVLNLESATQRSLSGDRVKLADALADAIGLGLEKVRLAKVREELTNTMVHDLRAPMVSILGSLEVLAASPRIDADERQMLRIGHRNATRQAELIDAILEIGRLEDGALPLDRDRVPLGELVADALDFAAPRALAQGLELIAQIPEDTPAPWIDRGLIARVLDNLVDNAIKFSETEKQEAGGTAVRISAVDLGTGSLEIRVIDGGPGIDNSLRRRLFQKFSPGSHAAGGSGLGLAFCRLAVEASGGRIWLEEPDGPGAVFAFTLPLTETDTLDHRS